MALILTASVTLGASFVGAAGLGAGSGIPPHAATASSAIWVWVWVPRSRTLPYELHGAQVSALAHVVYQSPTQVEIARSAAFHPA